MCICPWMEKHVSLCRHFLYGVCVYVPEWEKQVSLAETFLIKFMCLDGITCSCGRDISDMVYVYMCLDGKTC